MKRKEVSALYKVRIDELHERVTHLERQREQFVTDVYRIRNHPQMTQTKKNLEVYKFLKGNSYEDWVDYYNDHVDSLKNELMEHQKTFHEYSKPEANLWAAPLALLFVIGVLAVAATMLNPEITTLATIEPNPPEKNVVIENDTVTQENTEGIIIDMGGS